MNTATRKPAMKSRKSTPTVLNLSALHKELTRKLADLEIHVKMAPDAYEDVDGLAGMPGHPTFLEDAVVLHVMDMPPHGCAPVPRRWIIKRGKPGSRYFRVTVSGMFSEVHANGSVDNLMLIRKSDAVETFIRSVPPAQPTRKTPKK